MRYQIAYGRGNLVLDIPSRRLVDVIRPRPVRQLPDVEKAVRESLETPIASAPLPELLRGKSRVLVVTVDNTRPSPAPLILPILDLCTGLKVDVTVIIATGRHRQMTWDEIKCHLGQRITDTCRVLQHDAFDASQMVHVGRTSRGTEVVVNREVFQHDMVIGCGIIEPSYLCGWSGARKLLMPGLAHREAIDNNHYYVTQPGAEIGRLHGNPVSDDALEFSRELPLHFIVYSVAGPHDEAVAIVSGHPVYAHERACDLCAPIYRADVKSASIVVTSPGGSPYDSDLVQGKKAILPATRAVRPGGVIILCAECPEGLGAERTFSDWLRHKTPAEVMRDVLDREQFTLGAHGAYILARPIVEKGARVILVTQHKVAEDLQGSYVEAVTSIEDAWEMANRTAGRDASVLCMENARRLVPVPPPTPG